MGVYLWTGFTIHVYGVGDVHRILLVIIVIIVVAGALFGISFVSDPLVMPASILLFKYW